MILFGRRRWAIRVIEKTGPSIWSAEATVLIDLIIWASKNTDANSLTLIRKKLPKRESVLIAATKMADNRSAVNRVAQLLSLNTIEAENLLGRLRTASIEVAKENGLTKLVAAEKATPVTDAEFVEAEFYALKVGIECADAAQQFIFETGVAIIWQGFLGNFGSPAQFAKLARTEQMDYLRKSVACFLRMEEDCFEAALPQRMFNFYLAFLINGNTAFENEAAAFLDRYARKGWERF